MIQYYFTAKMRNGNDVLVFSIIDLILTLVYTIFGLFFLNDSVSIKEKEKMSRLSSSFEFFMLAFQIGLNLDYVLDERTTRTNKLIFYLFVGILHS